MTRQASTLSSILERPAFAWLDTIAEPAQKAASALFHSTTAGRKVKDTLNGTPLRHRAHPAIIVWPLGAWTTSVFLDAMAARATGRVQRGYQSSADTSIAFGIAGTAPAVATGLADWVDLYDQHRRVGIAHAMLNTVAVAFFGASYLLRMSGEKNRGAARVLSGAGFGAVMLSGALGGELVYTLGANVPHTVYPKPPNEFRDALPSAELTEGTPVVVEIDRVPVMLVRHEGIVHAVQEWCPHAGGPLSRGKIEGDVVECPWHQSRFCLKDGAPLQGPATVPLRTFDTEERGGMIRVRPSYEAMSWPPPPEPPREFPEHVGLEAGA